MLKHNICLLYKLYAKEALSRSVSIPFQINFVRACSIKTEVPTATKLFVKDDVDAFGTLGDSPIHEENIQDAGDLNEEQFLSNRPAIKKLRTKQYADMIKRYISKRQIQEAIDLVENRMIKEDRVKPENYIYNLLLGACGRVGYTKKAFKLFNDMKKRGLQPTDGTYTALFNACSNSPWMEDGLSRALKLKELMHEKGVIPNDTTCNAMIKAFGRCGDIQTAFTIVDNMIQNRIPIKTEAVNFLLQSCITKKDAGFLYALLVWQKFNQYRIKPDIYSFNLMLHCVRDCSLGDVEIAEKLLNDVINSRKISNQTKKKISAPTMELNFNNDKQNPPDKNSQILTLEIVDKQDLNINPSIPNMLSNTPSLGNLVKLKEMVTPDQRMLLIGGCSGFLNNMQHFNINPDIKTFTMLLDNIPSTTAAEQALLSAMKKQNIKIDIDFLNMLIKKRSLRFDYKGAKEVLNLFTKYNYKPNIITYGVLALGCETLEESRALLQEMFDSGYRVNTEILGALVKQACVKQNFVYVLEIMELVITEKIPPNKKFLEHLDKLHKDCIEMAKKDKKNGKFWKKGFHLFRMRYKSWLDEIKPNSVETEHPWTQFRNPVETNIKNYQDPAVHFKPRITSRYKQKTGTLQSITIKKKMKK